MPGARAPSRSTSVSGDARALAAFVRERRTVQLCAGGAQNDRAIRSAVLRGLDWGALAAIAANERAVQIIWRRISACAGDLVPPEAGNRLRGLTMIADFVQRSLEERLTQSLDALASAQVEVMVLKGAGLAGQVYAGFVERPMIDLDLLVRRADAMRARDVLREAGWSAPHDPALEEFYAAHHHLAPLEDRRGTGRTLELHTGLLPAENPFRWPAASVWRNAVPVRVAGRDVMAPSLVHQLLHLCLHFAWSHQFESGAWRATRDVGAIVASGEVPWGEFVALARQSRAASCCYWTFRLARAIADVRVPDGVQAQLRPSIAETVARRLESHLLMQLATQGAACPSLRLSRLAWSAAIRPAQSGHGRMRPWDHTEEYVPTAPEGQEAPPIPSGWTKLGAQRGRLASWRVYASAMMRGALGTPGGTR